MLRPYNGSALLSGAGCCGGRPMCLTFYRSASTCLMDVSALWPMCPPCFLELD